MEVLRLVVGWNNDLPAINTKPIRKNISESLLGFFLLFFSELGSDPGLGEVLALFISRGPHILDGLPLLRALRPEQDVDIRFLVQTHLCGKSP